MDRPAADRQKEKPRLATYLHISNSTASLHSRYLDFRISLIYRTSVPLLYTVYTRPTLYPTTKGYRT